MAMDIFKLFSSLFHAFVIVCAFYDGFGSSHLVGIFLSFDGFFSLYRVSEVFFSSYTVIALIICIGLPQFRGAYFFSFFFSTALENFAKKNFNRMESLL